MEHLDEGIIHAWLDGELPEREAAALEAHAKACQACSALISEARGLTAASSRILRSLDEVPSNVVPLSVDTLRKPSAIAEAEPGSPATAAQKRARRTWFRRPQFAAAAALLIVAAGTWRVTRDRSNATIADFAAPVVASEPPATTILDSSALSTATAVPDQVGGRTPNLVGQVAGAAKTKGPMTPPPPSAKKAEGGATGRAAAEREVAQPTQELSARERIMTPVPTASDAAAERKASTDSAGRGAARLPSAARPESDSARLARFRNSNIQLNSAVTTGASASTQTTSVRAELADSAARSEERRLRGENAAALGAARNDSAARRQSQGAAPAAAALRDATPIDAAVAQAAGCYNLEKLRSMESSLPSRIRLNTAVAREEPLRWYAAQGYPGNTAPAQWVWRVVPESGIQLAKVEGDRRVLTIMISGAAATTADRVVCP